jgi:predicted MFS family arabinose efflux permease
MPSERITKARKMKNEAARVSPEPVGRNVVRLALRFVLIVGIVNFFADMTYEGGRSIIGPFLGTLGANAAIVGVVAGLGELMGFGLRSVTGYLADKTHRYWAFAFVGYAVNMLAVPALALAGNWPLAAALAVGERTGRAIRKPATEAMLSEAGKSIGHGWVFGLNEALDQTGATLGPLIAAFILYRRGGYPRAFAALLVSALLCLAVLVTAFLFQQRTGAVTQASAVSRADASLPRAYRLYVVGGALIAAGFADFSLMAFHFQQNGTVSQDLIPVFYAVAMATGAIAAPVFGKLLDKLGLPVLLASFAGAAFFAPLVFLAGARAELVGMVLWGMGLGAQDACLKGTLSSIVPGGKRSTGFGIFDTWFGVAWFAGSATMGLLYQRSLTTLVIFSMLLQLLALPVFVAAGRQKPDVSATAGA